MTTQEDLSGFWGGTAGRQLHDKAYFLELAAAGLLGEGRAGQRPSAAQPSRP